MLREAIALSLVFTAKEIFDSAGPPRLPWRKKIQEELPHPFWQKSPKKSENFQLNQLKISKGKFGVGLTPPHNPVWKNQLYEWIIFLVMLNSMYQTNIVFETSGNKINFEEYI